MNGKELPPSPPSADDLEAGFSGESPLSHRRATFFFDDYSDDESHHFLDSCFLCKKHLRRNRDIYMYRGDTPFCSEECRQEQIEIDEARERNWKVAMMEKQKRSSSSSSPATSRDLRIRLGTVVPV